jgi:hypothetical protein
VTAPIIDITWSRQFDALLGTAPSAQGWAASGSQSASDTPSGGLLHMDGNKYWTRTDLANAPANGHVLIHARLQFNAGHVYGWDVYTQIPNVGTYNAPRLSLLGSYSGFGNHRYTPYDPYNGSVQGWLNMLSTTGVPFDVMTTVPIVSSVPSPRRAAIWYREAGANSRDGAADYIKLGHSQLIALGASNTLQFGDLFIGGGSDVSVECVRYGTVSTAHILSTDGQVLFDETIAARPTIILTTGNPAPDAGEDVTMGYVVDAGISATLDSNPISGTGSAVIASATTPATPTVALVLSAVEVAAGEVSTMTATITGDADVTLDNVPLTSGVAADAVSGIAADYVPPTTPATPVAYRDPSPASPSWSPDVSNLILSEPAAPATGQLAVTTIWLGYQPTPGAAAVKLTTGAGFTSPEVAASSVAESSITWATGTGVVTAWAALVTAIRALFPTALLCQGNDDGQVVTWSGGINPVAQGQYELTLSGEIDPDRIAGIPGAAYAEVRLDADHTAGNRTYPVQSYKGLIDRTTGQWQITELPRGQACKIKLPYGNWLPRLLPDTATATYGELAPPS